MNKVVDALFVFMITAMDYNNKKVALHEVIQAGQYYIACVREAKLNNTLSKEDTDHYLAFVGYVIETTIISS
jgi:fucose permease